MSVVKDSEIRSNLDKAVQFFNFSLIIIGILLISFGFYYRTAGTPVMLDLGLKMIIGGSVALVAASVGYAKHLKAIKDYKKI